MYQPRATLKILQKSLNYLGLGKTYYGPHGMERRIFRCCLDNLNCPFQDECYELYKDFVNRTDDPKAPSARKEAVGRSCIETYKFHGIKSLAEPSVLRL